MAVLFSVLFVMSRVMLNVVLILINEYAHIHTYSPTLSVLHAKHSNQSTTVSHDFGCVLYG